jgi:protein involved in polysaccharide export with SLBB domain
MSAGGNDLQLMPFDHVLIRKSPGYDRVKMVQVEGQVNFPGEYGLTNVTERISDLVKRAGGVNPYAYTKGAKLIRRTKYFKFPSENTITAINLAEVKANTIQKSKNDTEAEKILLSRINSKIIQQEERKDESSQTLNQVSATNEAIENLEEKGDINIQKSFSQEEFVSIDLQEILLNPGGKNDLILQEGDLLAIPKELQTVSLRGELLFPTTTQFEEGARFKKYISSAGGFTSRSQKSKCYVVYANGKVNSTKRFLFFNFYPRIEPGAEVFVSQKPEREGITAQGWIGIGTSLATLGLLINQLLPAN